MGTVVVFMLIAAACLFVSAAGKTADDHEASPVAGPVYAIGSLLVNVIVLALLLILGMAVLEGRFIGW